MGALCSQLILQTYHMYQASILISYTKPICQMSPSISLSPLSETLPKILLLEIDVCCNAIHLQPTQVAYKLQLIDSAGTRADKNLKTLLL